MLRQPLTDLAIRKLLSDFGRRVEMWDAALPGFGVRVSSTGTKSFVLLYRQRGQSRRMTLGRYPVLSLADARAMAKDVLSKVAHGIDSQQEKIEAKSSLQFAEVVDLFIRKHCEPHNRANTKRETERIMRSVFQARWGRRDIRDISKANVLVILDAFVDDGKPSSANHALAAIRKFFNWCLERGLLDISPTTSIKRPAKLVSRSRVLDDNELRAIWLSADSIGYPFGRLVQLLLLTGQRRNEVANMSWQQLDLKERTWVLPAELTKNNRAHVVPLTDAAMTVITSIPRTTDGLIFASRSSDERSFSGFSKCKRQLDTMCGITNWTLHDLRRSAATHLGRLKVPPHVVERILNHSSGTFAGVAGVYNRFEYLPEMREALELWASFIRRLVAASGSED